MGWPAPAAGIASVLTELDRTGDAPSGTPLLHSPAALAMWGILGCSLVLAISPGALAGAALAVLCGFGSGLALDALSCREMFLWPRTPSPADWLLPYRPECLVQLGGRTFLVPSPEGVVPRPWGGWRRLALRPEATGKKHPGRPASWLAAHKDPLLSAASLAALLVAVVHS